MRRTFICVALLSVLLPVAAHPPAAFAHDYRIEVTGGEFVLYQGHLYSTHAGEPDTVYDPSTITDVYCPSPGGGVARGPRPSAYPLRLAKTCSPLLVRSVSGYWSQTLTETVNKPWAEARGALRAWRAEESIKYFDAWSPALASPMADGLELVPLEDPTGIAPGDKLRMVALYRGKPTAGVVYAYDGQARGVTGEDGRFNLRVRRGGMQVLSASLELPLAGDPNADKLVLGAILQFPLRETLTD